MYKKPETKVAGFETTLMQLNVTLSPQGGEGPGGSTGNEAPMRGDIID